MPPAKVRGFFRLEASGPRGRRVLADWFPNLVTDLGLDRMGLSTADLCTTIVVGSGNTAPDAADEQLEAHVATSTANSPAGAQNIEMDDPPYYVDRVVAKRFDVGFASGDVDLREVGIGWGATTLFARSLIRDFSGSPTTVTVLADEYVDVFYRIRVDPPLSDGALSFSTGPSHTGTVRASVLPTNISSGYGFDTKLDGSSYYGYAYYGDVALGPLTGSPVVTSGGTQGISAGNGWSVILYPYVGGTFERRVRYVASPSGGNLSGGIVGLRTHTTLGFFQYVWSPAIAKTSDTQLFLDITYSWTRT